MSLFLAPFLIDQAEYNSPLSWLCRTGAKKNKRTRGGDGCGCYISTRRCVSLVSLASFHVFSFFRSVCLSLISRFAIHIAIFALLCNSATAHVDDPLFLHTCGSFFYTHRHTRSIRYVCIHILVFRRARMSPLGLYDILFKLYKKIVEIQTLCASFASPRTLSPLLSSRSHGIITILYTFACFFFFSCLACNYTVIFIYLLFSIKRVTRARASETRV